MKQKVAELINIIFGFRKFLLMLVITMVGIIFRIKGLLDGAQFVDLLKATTISFFAANGVEHIVAAVKQVKTGEVPGPADTDETNDEKEVDLK